MDWNLMGMLHAMSWTAKGVVIMLLLMSVISLCVAAERGLRYRAARHQSVLFVNQVTPVLEKGKLDEAISVAGRNRKSHIAAMVATGLTEFTSAPAHASRTELIDAAERGLDRSIATIHAELKSGLSGLATIGSTAPFVGLFGTVVGIMNAFRASGPRAGRGNHECRFGNFRGAGHDGAGFARRRAGRVVLQLFHQQSRKFRRGNGKFLDGTGELPRAHRPEEIICSRQIFPSNKLDQALGLRSAEG